MVQILKRERKKKIERAALDEFMLKGFLNASMRKIAQNAQISTSNLYNYFESKEKLFYSITDGVYNIINNLVRDLTRTEREIGRENFFDQVSNLIAKPIRKLIMNHREEFLLIMEGSQGTKYENFQEELVIVIENPSELRHRFDLGHVSLRNLVIPHVSHEDCDRIRYLFLERVRISYGLSQP